MAVQQEIKSQLARLLATEDLVVEHKNVETAQFNVHTRELILPLWEKASGIVYDMLVGHEVGHALFTPDEDWTEDVQIPSQFINIVEDVRIEKLMKRKYMGIAKTFYKGYNELYDKDFFQIDDEDIDSLNLADRINLYYKIGSFIDIPFNSSEEQIVSLIGKCETFDEVKKASKILYDYCKDQLEKENDKQDNDDQPQGNLDSQSEEVQTNIEQESVSTQEVKSESHDVDFSQGDQSSNDTEPEVKTANSFDNSLKDLIGTGGKENVYISVPDLNIENIIAKVDDVHKEIEYSFSEQQKNWEKDTWRSIGQLGIKNLYEVVDADYNHFKRDAQKEVNYLLKEFECKKAASSYARAATSRTGVLDTSNLHSYKYNEDLFKRVTVIPEGKNHGLIFIIDWSGSMSRVLKDTIKQLYNLVWFCKKASIPFEVYAFTNEWRRRKMNYENGVYETIENLPSYCDRKEYEFDISDDFSLMNILSSKVRGNVLEQHMKNIWRVACSFTHGQYYTYPNRLSLSGTPLNESLVCLHKILPIFQKENKLEKVQCVILTDGEASPLTYNVETKKYYEDEMFMGTKNVDSFTCSIRDRKLGKNYSFDYTYNSFTDALVRNLRDRFTSTNFIGIRVLESREASYFIRRNTKDFSSLEKVMKDWRKTKTFNLTETGYHAYFGMSSSALSEESQFDVDDNATKTQIKRAFVKSLKTKKLNKKVLGEFISLVA